MEGDNTKNRAPYRTAAKPRGVIAKKQKGVEQEEMLYFTKVRGLATVVWDAEENRTLAEFDKQGLYSTKDRKIAKRLMAMGYRRVLAEHITGVGLMLPEDYKEMRERKPGKGYTEGGKSVPMQLIDMEMAPGEGVADSLFDPDLNDIFGNQEGGQGG